MCFITDDEFYELKTLKDDKRQLIIIGRWGCVLVPKKDNIDAKEVALRLYNELKLNQETVESITNEIDWYKNTITASRGGEEHDKIMSCFCKRIQNAMKREQDKSGEISTYEA